MTEIKNTRKAYIIIIIIIVDRTRSTHKHQLTDKLKIKASTSSVKNSEACNGLFIAYVFVLQWWDYNSQRSRPSCNNMIRDPTQLNSTASWVELSRVERYDEAPRPTYRLLVHAWSKPIVSNSTKPLHAFRCIGPPMPIGCL